MADIFETLLNTLAERAAPPLQTTAIDGETVALVKDGYKVQHLDEFSDRLRRPKESIEMFRIESFLGYWNRFAKDASVAFGDLKDLRLDAVIDYHDADNAPGYAEHAVRFSPRRGHGWGFWTGLSGKWLDQRAFQRVIEERAADIATPPGADLLELVANLEATMRVEAVNVERLDNGARRIHYVKNNQTAGGVVIPAALTLSVSVFEGQEPGAVVALLRWDIDDETHKAKFKLEIPDIPGLEMLAFERLADTAVKAIGDRFFWGRR